MPYDEMVGRVLACLSPPPRLYLLPMPSIARVLLSFVVGLLLLARSRYPHATFVAACVAVLVFPYDSTIALMALTALLARRNDTRTTVRAIAAGGFIIQPLPDASEEVLTQLETNLGKIRPVSAMVEAGLDGKGIIGELLTGFADVQFLTTTELAFKCQCSKRHTEDILMTLQRKDMDLLIGDGKAEVYCQFCGEKYQFTKEELVALANVGDTLRARRAKKNQ